MNTRTQQTIGGLLIPLLALLLAATFAPGNSAAACSTVRPSPPTTHIANWVINLFDEQFAPHPISSLQPAGTSEAMEGSFPSAD